MGPAFFEQLCQALAKSMDTESSEAANKTLFSVFDKDKVGIHFESKVLCLYPKVFCDRMM